MKVDWTIISHYITQSISSWMVTRMCIMSLGLKGLNVDVWAAASLVIPNKQVELTWCRTSFNCSRSHSLHEWSKLHCANIYIYIFKIQRTSKNIQPYCTLKCLISYLLSNCFDSKFCKHMWTERKLAKRAACDTWCVKSVVEYWLIKTTCQSGSFQLNKQ